VARKVEVLSEELVLDAYLSIKKAQVKHELQNGQMSDAQERWNVARGDAASALVYNTDRKQLILVRQFRYPTVIKGSGWLLETIAGMVDEGETPDQAVRREIEEEIGFRAANVEQFALFYVSPGAVDERVFLFYAEVGESNRTNEGGGKEEEGEDLEIFYVSPEEARRMVERQEITDAKTLIALQWLQLRGLS
jgi:nudix-type nucleoside diphosphatase (YffH/AdpP family)